LHHPAAHGDGHVELSKNQGPTAHITAPRSALPSTRRIAIMSLRLNLRLLFIPLILATSAAFSEAKADAQADASSLLDSASAYEERQADERTAYADPATTDSAYLDPQASAATLLGWPQSGLADTASHDSAAPETYGVRAPRDAQMHAAALIGWSSASTFHATM
jgi:hypothetical protein